MTKPRDLAGSVNPNSIPGSRIEDGTITSAKLSGGFIPEDGSVNDSKVASDADIQSSKLSYLSQAVDAAARTVRDKLGDVVSIKDFGAVADGVTSCTAAFNAALASLPSSGGTIFFPSGDYSLNILLTVPNVNLIGEAGTILRADSSSSVIDIQDGGENIVISNLILSGQTLAGESITPPTNNTRGLHGLRIFGGKKIFVHKVRAYAGRYDGLYVRTAGDADLVFEGCEFGPSSRNSVSIVDGNKMVFRDCLVRSSNEYKSSAGNHLYLFDIEPAGADTCKDFYFENCTFLGGANGSNLVIMGSNLPDDTYFNCTFDGCYFRKVEGFTGGSMVAIRPRFECRGLTVRNSVFHDRVLVQAGSASYTMKDSSFEDIELGSPAFTYATFISDGCFLKNITTTSTSPLSISGATNSEVTIVNVQDYDDQIGKKLRARVDADVLGSLQVGTVDQPGKVQIGPTNVDSGSQLTFTKGGNYTLGNSQVIMTISGVSTTRVFQTWEVLISSQSTGTSQSRRQRSTKFAFMITSGGSGTPIVDTISGYGWPDTLSSAPGGGDRDPGSLNPVVSVNPSGDVEIRVDVSNTVSSGSNRINILAHGTGSYISQAEVS